MGKKRSRQKREGHAAPPTSSDQTGDAVDIKREGAKRKAEDDIDAIFASSKASKAGDQASRTPSKETTGDQDEKNKEKKGKPGPVKGSKDDLFGSSDPGRKRTDEGYRIFTEEELGLTGKGGDTEDCPFDCSCCF